MAVNQKANVDVTLNNEQAKRELEELQNEMQRLIALRDKAQKEGDTKSFKQTDAQLKKATREAKNFQKQLFDVNKALKNLSGASIQDLRKAQHALTIQTSKLNRESAEYVQKSKQLKLVSQELARINGNQRAGTNTFGRVADAANRYFSIIGAGIATITGLSLTIRQTTKAYAEHEDKLADVMKTTGLTREQVGILNEELKKIDTRTSQENLLDLARVAGKLGITSQNEIMGFVRASDQIAVALTEDLGGNVEDSINQLGKLVDIFKLKDQFGIEQSLLKVGSAINSLGAAGTANEGYLVEFAKRVAGIAPSAGVSIENVLGLGATLDELGQTSEVSGTVYSQFIGGMFKDTQTYAGIAKMSLSEFTTLLNTDANEAFIRVLEGARGSSGAFGEMAKSLDGLGLDGARATAVLGVLASNTDKLREKQAFANQEFEKGTSLTQEFNTKNNTAQANLEKAKKRFAELSIELGQKLTPAYTSVISKARLLVEVIKAIVEFLSKYGKVLVASTAAVAAYTITLQFNSAAKIKNLLQTRIAIALTKTYTTLVALLTGQINLASVAQRAWNTAVKSNPIGAVLSVITAVAGAIWLYSQRTQEATAKQKALKDIQDKTNKAYSDELAVLDQQFFVLKNLNPKSEKRAVLIKEINDKYGQYLPNLLEEKATLEDIDEAYQAIIASLRQKIELEVIQDKAKEIFSDLFLKQEEFERLSALPVEKFNKEMKVIEGVRGEYKRRFMADLKGEINELQSIYEGLLTKVADKTPLNKSKTNNDNLDYDGLENDTGVTANDMATKALKALDQAHQERLLRIEQQAVKEKKSEEWLLLEKSFAERAYYEQKLAFMQQAGDQGIEIQRKLIERELEIIKQTDDKIKELRDNNIDEFTKWLDERNAQEEDALTKSVDENIAYGKEVKQDSDNRIKAEREQLASRADSIMAFTESIGNSFQDFLTSQDMSFDEFLKNTLLQTLDFIEKMMIAAIAQTTIKSIMEGAPINIAAVAKAAAKILLLKAAFGVAKAAIIGKGEKKEGYAEGGHTGSGNQHEVAGVVHKEEWVAPKWMVDSPATGPIINALENIRKTKYSFNTSGLNTLANQGYFVGGPVIPSKGMFRDVHNKLHAEMEPPKTTNPEDPVNPVFERVNGTLDRVNSTLTKLEKKKWSVSVELIQKGLQDLDEINRHRGL